MLTLRVQSVNFEAERILSFVLTDPNGAELPLFEPGAHIDIQIPGGVTRQYSLCDPSWERDHYRVAVLDVLESRGGSRAMHHSVKPGDILRVSEPRNMFRLANEAVHSLLIAGGIGITPILAMAEDLSRRKQSFELHYCSQDPERTAFLGRIAPFVASGQAKLHYDGGSSARHLDVATLLQSYCEGTHLYFCGPAGLMTAIRNGCGHWPREAVHYEYFGAPRVKDTSVEYDTFNVVLQRSNRTIRISSDETILTAVRSNGIECESSCEAGLCGACRVRYLSGCPEHNDFVLSEEDRREFVLICCARAMDDSLVLDI